MNKAKTTLWSLRNGQWYVEREISQHMAQLWLGTYQSQEPDVTFCVSEVMPGMKQIAKEFAK